MKTLNTICLSLLVTALLSVSAAAIAGQRDSLGSKPSYGNRSAALNQRKLADNRQHGNRYNNRDKARNNNRDKNRYDHSNNHSNNHSSTSVNIIVGRVAPISRWSPTYNYGYNNRFNRSYSNNTFIFDSSLGYLPRGVVNTIYSPVVIRSYEYESQYPATTNIIRYSEPVSSVILFKDRYGQCFEKETDSYGQEIKRQIADYNCDF